MATAAQRERARLNAPRVNGAIGSFLATKTKTGHLPLALQKALGVGAIHAGQHGGSSDHSNHTVASIFGETTPTKTTHADLDDGNWGGGWSPR